MCRCLLLLPVWSQRFKFALNLKLGQTVDKHRHTGFAKNGNWVYVGTSVLTQKQNANKKDIYTFFLLLFWLDNKNVIFCLYFRAIAGPTVMCAVSQVKNLHTGNHSCSWPGSSLACAITSIGKSQIWLSLVYRQTQTDSFTCLLFAIFPQSCVCVWVPYEGTANRHYSNFPDDGCSEHAQTGWLCSSFYS